MSGNHTSVFAAAAGREFGGKAAMRGFSGYLLIGGLAVLAMGLVTVAGLAVGARPIAEPGQVIQYVDRTHKANRLDLRTTSGTRPAMRPSQRQPHMVPVGCEPAFSSLESAARANYFGRCVVEFAISPRILAG